MKRYIGLILCLCLIGVVYADDEVSFRASAPAQVVVGQPFQVSYQINQRVKDFRAPQMDNFDVLAGPYTSQSTSMSFVNGKRSSNFTLTYTYTIVGTQTGTFTIPPATATYNKENCSSNGVRIEVLPSDETPQQSTTQQQSSSRPQQQVQRTSDDGGGSSNSPSEKIFLRTIVTKTRVHEQEALLLSYKLYFVGVDVSHFTQNTKLPEFKGFVKNVFEQDNVQTELEHYNGRNYQTAVLYKTLLFPQHAGDIVIEPATFEAVLRVQNRSRVRSIFDDFFNSYSEVTRALKAPGVTIHTEALPKGKPNGFSGGVGKFNITSNISTTSPKANEAVTLKIDISGTGNMKLVKTPAIDWPEGFEVYDPKVNNNFKNTANGTSGKKSIEYLAIPRSAGDYTIPSVKFSYFDVERNEYKTLTTPEYVLHVERGQGDNSATQAIVSNYVNKEDIKQLGTDIRFIHTGTVTHKKVMSTPVVFGTLNYWLWYIIPLLLAIILFIVFRRQIKENANLTRVRYKRANKVAQKRLKEAFKMMKVNKKSSFYEEIERAVWTYLSDRLAIPTANLNKENIYDILRSKDVNEDTISNLHEVLSTTEFARYAPSQDAQAMQTLYDHTAKVIDLLEHKKL